MELNRDELLRQKALIEEQLRWIESKLAEQSDDSKEEHASRTATTDETQTPSAEADQEIELESISQASVDFESGEAITDNSTAGTLTRREKIGCAVIVLLFCIGILIIFFVLPYWIY